MTKRKLKGTSERGVDLKEFSDELAKFFHGNLKNPIAFGARNGKFEIGSEGVTLKITAGAFALKYSIEEVVDVPKLDFKKKRGEE
jgi:hypothetical protein